MRCHDRFSLANNMRDIDWWYCSIFDSMVSKSNQMVFRSERGIDLKNTLTIMCTRSDHISGVFDVRYFDRDILGLRSKRTVVSFLAAIPASPNSPDRFLFCEFARTGFFSWNTLNLAIVEYKFIRKINCVFVNIGSTIRTTICVGILGNHMADFEVNVIIFG